MTTKLNWKHADIFFTNMDNFYNPRPSGQYQPICFVHAKSESSTQFKEHLSCTFLMRESDTIILFKYLSETILKCIFYSQEQGCSHQEY